MALFLVMSCLTLQVLVIGRASVTFSQMFVHLQYGKFYGLVIFDAKIMHNSHRSTQLKDGDF